jgi:hypothetical protein
MSLRLKFFRIQGGGKMFRLQTGVWYLYTLIYTHKDKTAVILVW